MRKALVTGVVLALALVGCGPVADIHTEEVSYKFEATVAVNPTAPQANQRVLLNLEVTSSSNRPVKTDITLTVLNAEGQVKYESLWEDVYFHENEVWNLTQGFLPDSDAGSSKWTMRLKVHNKEANLPLLDQSIGTIDFGKK